MIRQGAQLVRHPLMHEPSKQRPAIFCGRRVRRGQGKGQPILRMVADLKRHMRHLKGDAINLNPLSAQQPDLPRKE